MLYTTIVAAFFAFSASYTAVAYINLSNEIPTSVTLKFWIISIAYHLAIVVAWILGGVEWAALVLASEQVGRMLIATWQRMQIQRMFSPTDEEIDLW